MNWLQKIAQQQQITVYHGSSTGANNTTLQSFRQGTQNKGGGYGQGGGFYVWTDYATAKNHATGFGQDGYPMVLAFAVTLNPEEWDIDYELMPQTAAQAIARHWQEFQSLGPIQIGNTIIDPSRSTTEDGGIGIYRSLTAGRKMIRFDDQSSGGGAGIEWGKLLSNIIQRMEQINPQIILEMEQQAFSNLKPGQALKYVGQGTLMPTQIQAFVNNQWIDVTSQDPPIQQQQQQQDQQPMTQNPPVQQQPVAPQT